MADEKKNPDVKQPKRDVRLAQDGQLKSTYTSAKKQAARKVAVKSLPAKKK